MGILPSRYYWTILGRCNWTRTSQPYFCGMEPTILVVRIFCGRTLFSQSKINRTEYRTNDTRSSTFYRICSGNRTLTGNFSVWHYNLGRAVGKFIPCHSRSILFFTGNTHHSCGGSVQNTALATFLHRLRSLIQLATRGRTLCIICCWLFFNQITVGNRISTRADAFYCLPGYIGSVYSDSILNAVQRRLKQTKKANPEKSGMTLL